MNKKERKDSIKNIITYIDELNKSEDLKEIDEIFLKAQELESALLNTNCEIDCFSLEDFKIDFLDSYFENCEHISTILSELENFNEEVQEAIDESERLQNSEDWQDFSETLSEIYNEADNILYDNTFDNSDEIKECFNGIKDRLKNLI